MPRASEVPPPEERVCKRHNKPICPSRWRNGLRNCGCSRCGTELTMSPKWKERRRKKWNTKIITCIDHPDRRCNQAEYICTGHRYCSSCKDRLQDGSYRPEVKRKWAEKEFRNIMKRRRYGSQFHHSSLRGIDLFNRIIGYNLISPTGAIQL